MNILLYILIFIIGTLFGSFFTLATYRIPLGQDITHKRSYCPNCNHKLSFWDMIPIFSYIFLGGKCRYCKTKIRIRYLLLEVITGIVFTLFALSINLNIYTISLSKILYLVFGLLYISILFIIAGIDKERYEVKKNVLLVGIIIQTLYIIYLYVVEKDPNMYRYVIYLFLLCMLVLVDINVLKKKAKASYPVEVLMLSMYMILFTYEWVFFMTVCFTLLAIVFYLILRKIKFKKNVVKEDNKKELQLPIAFYMCTANILCLIVTNMCAFWSF